MAVEYRHLVADDLEQAAYVESVAFYGEPTAERLERMRTLLPADWTIGAFVDGRLVADTRVIPMARRINGSAIPFGCVGPVACLAEHRRQGYVGRLLRLWLERMREGGAALSGLYTPHDALYQRYGWERAEGKTEYRFRARDVTLRVRGGHGRMEPAGPDDWQRLDEIYRRYAEPRNGALQRPEPWWRHAVLSDTESSKPRQAFVWVAENGEDQGFTVYFSQGVGWQPGVGGGSALVVREIVALTPDAYLGLWQHLLGHDIARPIVVFAPPDDPFARLAGDPSKVETARAEGAMIRVVDVERAFRLRPCVDDGGLSFALRVIDHAAPWNDGVWRIEAVEGRMQAERSDGEPDLEVSANFLAPLFTGHLAPAVAAETGMLKVHRPQALAAATRAFAVTHLPYCSDWY